MPQLVGRPEHALDRQEGKNKGNEEGEAAAGPLGEDGKGIHADAGADLLEQKGDAGVVPPLFLR